MANVYKLQRYVNGNWVDVQLGQMNNVPVTQTDEATPALLSDEPETTTPVPTNNVGTVLEQYLTLSQVQNEFLSTSVLRGNPTLQTIEQGLATAIGINSVAFGDAATTGSGAVAFGPHNISSLDSSAVPGYWHTEDDGTDGIFYMKKGDIASQTGDKISDLEKRAIRAIVDSKTYYLIITQVTPYNNDYYKFSFSSAIGDWAIFHQMIDGLLAEADSELLRAQFTFINSLARGNNSFMTGTGNVTLQDNSNALGQGLRATTRNQTVVGQYNADSDAFFVVGCGQYSSTKNILEAYSNGVRINAPIVKLSYYGRSNPIGDNDEYSLIIPDYENWRDQFEEVRIYWGHNQWISNAYPFENPIYNFTGPITTMRLPEYDSSYTINNSSSIGLTTNHAGSIMVLQIKNGCLSATVDGVDESFNWLNPNSAPYFVLEFIKPRK